MSNDTVSLKDLQKLAEDLKLFNDSSSYVEVFPNVRFSITKMPNKFHRVMMRLCFGWKFVEGNKPQDKQLLLG